MADAVQRERPRLSVELFRGFLEGRPDEEHWELIDGAAVMMAPPTLAHQIIAGNLQFLLRQSLEGREPPLAVVQRAGVNLAPPVEDYDPEPDLIVIDAAAAEKPGERYATRFYLAAEIVSSSDRTYVESKRAVYRLQEPCTCVLVIDQDHFEVGVDLRTDAGWSEQVLTKSDDQLVLADFGLRCKVSDLYRGTPLLPLSS